MLWLWISLTKTVNFKKFQRLIEISRALLPKYANLRCFHTTFIINKGKIVSIGWNNQKTHPKNLQFNYKSQDGKNICKEVGLHSELAAILKYGKEDLSNHIFVNIRIGKDGKPKIARPCNGCFSAINQFGYKKLFYTNHIGEFEELSV